MTKLWEIRVDRIEPAYSESLKLEEIKFTKYCETIIGLQLEIPFHYVF